MSDAKQSDARAGKKCASCIRPFFGRRLSAAFSCFRPTARSGLSNLLRGPGRIATPREFDRTISGNEMRCNTENHAPR